MALTHDTRDGNPFLVTSLPPSRRQQQLAVCMMVVVAGALAFTAPVARVPLANTEILLPAYAAAIFLNEVITAVLLLALYSVQRSRAILVLSIGYLFSGLMVVPWALTFPGVFETLGLPEPGLQSTASIAALRRLGFPLCVLAYALLKNSDASTQNSYAPASGTIFRNVAGVVAVACGSAWLIVAGDDALPQLMIDSRNISDLWQYVPATAVLLYLASLVILWRRQQSMLDFWLIIVLCTLLLELIHLSYLSAGIRLSVGWWAGRLYGLTSASLVLLVLLSQTTTLYARLSHSVSAERRARQDRLAAMEALSALIAHEVKQPVASMVTNADAGLRWLGRKSPDLKEAGAALKRIVDDGHRAGDVIEGIKTMFKKSAQERVPLNLNQLIRDVLRRSQDEIRLGSLSVEIRLDEHLPLTTGNPIQLQQVVFNLISNSIEAMRSVTDRPRVLRVRTEQNDLGSVRVSIEDTGTGLDPEHKDRIFEPFFTTNPESMGMGLMFCRSIVEAHGGRLWATENAPHGAIFQFSLPHNEDTSLIDRGPLR